MSFSFSHRSVYGYTRGHEENVSLGRFSIVGRDLRICGVFCTRFVDPWRRWYVDANFVRHCWVGGEQYWDRRHGHRRHRDEYERKQFGQWGKFERHDSDVAVR